MLTICSIVMIVCGIILLIVPKNKLYDPNKIIDESERNSIVKRYRLLSIIFIVLGIVFLII